jgi:hypothetical protein
MVTIHPTRRSGFIALLLALVSIAIVKGIDPAALRVNGLMARPLSNLDNPLGHWRTPGWNSTASTNATMTLARKSNRRTAFLVGVRYVHDNYLKFFLLRMVPALFVGHLFREYFLEHPKHLRMVYEGLCAA